MWYFAWALGLPLAVLFALTNVLWHDAIFSGNGETSQSPHQ